MSNVRELRDSVAFSAGQSYQCRLIAERLRRRASLIEQMPGRTGRAVSQELRFQTDLIEQEPA